MQVEFIEAGRVTVAKVTVREVDWVDPHVGIGAAICHPDDRPNWSIGRALALARALQDVRRQLIRDAYDSIEGCT